MTEQGLREKERFLHRDLSWLKFNERVLEEAQDPVNPLLEQAKFLAIFVSNLDEFYMVRVAGLKDLTDSQFHKRDRFGYYPQEIISEIQTATHGLITRLYDVYQTHTLKNLADNRIHIRAYDELKPEQRKFVQQYFETTIFPITTPMAVDPGHPFPVLPSKTLAFAVHVRRKEEMHLAIIPIPTNIPRLLRIPSSEGEFSFILVDEIIRKHLKEFFKGYQVKAYSLFRLIRDSEFFVEEEFTPDLLKAIEEQVRQRARAKVVYIETEKNIEPELLENLCQRLEFEQDQVIGIDGHLDLTFLFQLSAQVDKPELFYESYVPSKIEYDDIFERIRENDFMIHLPYQSFDLTLDFIERAAKDEKVLAIKMTLYRMNRDSAIVRALQEAAENKKQVTILVEIKARFDEENNIRWVRELEEAGCHVIYGMPGLKVHSKMTLVVRQEEGQIRRYVHLSTGNYNEKTAKVYTDIGYFTANEDFARDISDIFNVVTGFSMPSPWQRVITSPNDLREYFFSLIDREIEFQKKSKNGEIWVKINSLEDPPMIDKLYEASAAGVRIKLLVRGICCLIPGRKDLSKTITVKSIVGRFLEHSRIFIFNNNNSPRVFLSSADWMRRNLDRRIEVLYEVYNESIKDHLRELMKLYWKDTVKTRILTSEKNYIREDTSKEKFNIQEHLIRHYGASHGRPV